MLADDDGMEETATATWTSGGLNPSAIVRKVLVSLESFPVDAHQL